MNAYTARDACRLSGCAYKTLDFWCKSGVVTPSIRQADGKGSDRLFSATDIRCLTLVMNLRRVGIPLRIAAQFADHFRAHPDLCPGNCLVWQQGTVTTAYLVTTMKDGAAILAKVPAVPPDPASRRPPNGG